MEDFFLTLAIHYTIVLTLIVALKKLNIVQLHFRWLTLSLSLFVGYFAVLFFLGNLIPLDNYFPDLQWNWSGKITSILFCIFILTVIALCKKDFSISDAGFTFRQNEGSVKPALFVLVGVVFFQALLSYFLGEGPTYDIETLLYQSLIPGLDEEPMFRGVLLYTFTLALTSTRFNVLGAQMNVAGLIIVALFGMVHGMMYMSGEFVFSGLGLFITSFYGLVLLWLRERTGSLLLPIIAHNAINLVGQLI